MRGLVRLGLEALDALTNSLLRLAWLLVKRVCYGSWKDFAIGCVIAVLAALITYMVPALAIPAVGGLLGWGIPDLSPFESVLLAVIGIGGVAAIAPVIGEAIVVLVMLSLSSTADKLIERYHFHLKVPANEG